MVSPTSLPFNPKPSTIMHIDLNSCFATIEQQANPLLRGKPIAVAAYTNPSGCIVAPSVEAKKLGIKTGMRVKEGRMLCPDLIVMTPDPWKYRNIHLKLRNLLRNYTDTVIPKSIDEFVLDLEGYPSFKVGLAKTASEIKRQIKQTIGEWLTVSVGIAPNRFLAKLASSLHKPDGLDEINKDNFLEVYKKLDLMDLFWIKKRNAARLNNFGIYSVVDFYNASISQLKGAFQSIIGYYWYLRLHGWEIDDVEFARRSFGNSVALGKPLTTNEEITPILQKLVEKASSRMRKAGFRTRGIHIAVLYRDGSFWHRGMTLEKVLLDSRDIYKEVFRLFTHSPYKDIPVRELAVSCFNLIKGVSTQLGLFSDEIKKESLYEALDKINERWGDFTVTPGLMMGAGDNVKDRIAFGGVKELEDFIFSEKNGSV